jgi:hypothetical protein
MEDTYPVILLQKLAKAMPGPFECQDFHHFKKDYHDYDEPCPCLERFRLVMIELEAYLKALN